MLFLFFLFLRNSYYIVQTRLHPRSAYFSLLKAGITSMCHHACLLNSLQVYFRFSYPYLRVIKKKDFIFIYVHETWASAHGDQRRASNPLELELQVLVSIPIWAPEPKLQSSYNSSKHS